MTHQHYGLRVFEIDGFEWAVGTEDQIRAAAAAAIRESAWAFTSDFVAAHSEVIGSMSASARSKFFEAMQSLCEDANEVILALVDNVEDFVEDAIDADGAAHFLNTYDGEEYSSDDVDGLDDETAAEILAEFDGVKLSDLVFLKLG